MSKTTKVKDKIQPDVGASEKEQRPKKSKALTIVGIVLCVILVPILAVNVTMVIQGFTNPGQVPSVFGYSPLMVLTGSMEDTIMENDLIIIKSAEAADVRIGDVISFYDPDSSSGAVLTHRCVQIISADLTNGHVTDPTVSIIPGSDVHATAVFKVDTSKSSVDGWIATVDTRNEDGTFIGTDECTATVSPRKVVKNSNGTYKLVATAADGYEFVTWEFDKTSKYTPVSGSLTDSVFEIKPASDIKAHAIFKSVASGSGEKDYYSLFAKVSGGGSIDLSANKVSKDSEEKFVLTAIPDDGYRFDHWEFYGTDLLEIVTDGASSKWFVTKGDANAVSDKSPVPQESVIGKYQLRIPAAGKIAYWMQTTPGLIVCIAVPIVLLVGYDLIMKKRYDKKKKKDTDALLAELESLRAQAAGKEEKAPQIQAEPEITVSKENNAEAKIAEPVKAKSDSDSVMSSVDALIDEITSEDHSRK